MGVGRRMKKQGPPELLSEEHFANLKRKKGIPVDDVPAEAPSSKKRKTAKKNGKENAVKQANGSKTGKGALKGGKNPAAPKASKRPVPEPESDEELDDEFGAEELEAGDDSSLDGDEIGGAKLGDEFFGSDGSVYDSDHAEGRGKEKFVFSDDEDEDDDEREERLTAANIEGLSRKLDKQLEEDEAENEAELREGALQTNIEGDKPDVLEDEDGDDAISKKPKTMLAPDLQLLRTRITEAIRVLEDFSNLAAEGRSRADYTSQLLKDFCACRLMKLRSFLPFVSTCWRRISLQHPL
jgi:25S rRNA (cytosine2870-C5)-methyltransferase